MGLKGFVVVVVVVVVVQARSPILYVLNFGYASKEELCLRVCWWISNFYDSMFGCYIPVLYDRL